MDERKPVPPMYNVWNDTCGCWEYDFSKMREESEKDLSHARDLFPDESFRLVKLVEAVFEDGGDVS